MNLPINLAEPAYNLSVGIVPFAHFMKDHSHSHPNVEINFMESGSVIYLLGGRLQELKAGQLGVFWAGYPHRIYSAKEGAVMIWVTLPLQEFLKWQFSKSFHRRLLGGELLIDELNHPEHDRMELRMWHEDIGSRRSGFEEIVLLEYQARLKRLEGNLGIPRRSCKMIESGNSSSCMLATAAVKMAIFISRNFNRNIHLEDIAGSASLHPNYAVRLFKKNFGVTIGRFLQQYRVAHAEALLQTTDAKVLDIALDSGFQSLSRFYEIFKREKNQSPKKIRIMRSFHPPLPRNF